MRETSDSVLSFSEIQSSVEKVAKIYDLKRVALFGSYASNEQTSKSDIDLLIEFSASPVSIYKLAGVKLKMEELTGKSVDVIYAPIPKGSLIEVSQEVILCER